MHERRRTVAVAVGLGLLHGVVVLAPVAAFRGPSAGVPAWVPQLGTTGTTVVAYTYLFRGFEFLVAPVLVLGAGYWLAGRLDLRHHHRRFLGLFAAGSFAGAILGRATIVAVLLAGAPSAEAVATVVVPAVGTAVELTLVALAGVALAFFAGDGPPAEPADATHHRRDGTSGD